MDLANGAAATADGLIPFGDPFADLYQNGDIWSDDYEGLSDYERSLYEKSKTGGKIAQQCLLSAAVPGASANLARSGFYGVGAGVTHRASSPFLRYAGSRWFSKMQTDALLQTPRLGNFAGTQTWYGNSWNWLTTIRYARPGGGEIAYNWFTGKIIHANPFY